MKKITDFIVDKRCLVFCTFIILTAIALFVSFKVNINRDITHYLPKTSMTRKGMDIMDEEFGENDSSTLNVMFKDLSKKEKRDIYKEIKGMKGVFDVDYDNTKTYNKNGYTLYVVTVDGSKESKLASNLYDQIIKKYEGYKIETSGDVSEENKVVLPVWIVFLAIFCALVILLIMCDSFVEPLLFLLAIGMGVFLNKGTNIIFPSISSITNSIAAILQLALSMDYSIMLMNRYRQEKEKESNNVIAMKKALFKSFKSISSSSVTTIVGLLALVFMSFTIGKDLGFVLAKGVLFSLLTIFTCLPFLILTFDKLINKTKKKAPVIKLNKLGKGAYKVRYVGLPLFILIFGISFMLKGNLGILYTDSDSDVINKVFDTNNQIAIIYKNGLENKISNYCKSLEKDKKIDDVLCYGNTINDKLRYDQIKDKLSDLGEEVNVDDYMIKIIYYNYFNKDNNKMTLNEFIKFIKKDVYNHENLNKKVSKDMKNNIDKLENFTDITQINKKRDAYEIANMFEIKDDEVNDLLIYYNSLNNKTKMNLQEFVLFINNYVYNSKYASSIDKNAKNKLNQLAKFVNKNNLNKKINYKDMASLLNVDEEVMKQLFSYYLSNNDISYEMSISQFANFVTNNVLNNKDYQSMIDEKTKQNISLLTKFSNKNIINKKLSIKEMSSILGIDEKIITNVYILKFGSVDNNKEYTINELVTYITKIKNETNYLDNLDLSALSKIPPFLLESTNKYKADQIADLLKIDKKQVYMIYALIDYINNDTANWQLSMNELVTYIINNKDNEYLSGNLNKSMLDNLMQMNFIMSSTQIDKKFKYDELAKNLKINSETVKSIYSLFIMNNDAIKISPADIVKFLESHKNDQILSKYMSKEMSNNLMTVNQIIDSVLNNKRYNASALAKFLKIDEDKMKLLFSLYDIEYKKNEVNISYREFVQFLLDNVITNNEYKNRFTDDKIKKIKTIDIIIKNSINNNKYTKDEVFAITKILSEDNNSNLIDLVYMYYGSENIYDKKWKLTIEEFINYLNNDILNDSRFDDFIDKEMRDDIKDGADKIDDAKNLLVGDNYSRVVLNTKYELEDKEAINFMKKLSKDLNDDDIYFVGNTPMAYDMSQTFNRELNFITVLTIIFIFVIVAVTFKSFLIPLILVMLIQTAVYITMGILSFGSGNIYFIAILIVQSILMGATIDYAILYTSYYLESRKKLDVKKSVINAYNNSIHTILTSASILSLVTLVIGHLGSATVSKICMTISQGTICSTIIILFVLPLLIASLDKYITKNKI